MDWRHNNYIPPAPEPSAMLPDEFSVGDFRLVTRLLSYVQDLKYKALEIRVLWFLKKALTSREEPDISLSIVNRKKARLHLLYTHVRYAQYTHDFIRSILNGSCCEG